jgi:hypothetical protein
VTLPDRLYPAAVFAAHGVVDNLITAGFVLELGTTSIESNPLLVQFLKLVLLAGSTPAQYVGLFLLFKASVTFSACSLLWFSRSYIPRWRTLATFLTVIGIIIPLNNIFAVSPGNIPGTVFYTLLLIPILSLSAIFFARHATTLSDIIEEDAAR